MPAIFKDRTDAGNQLAPDHTIYLNEDLVARAALTQSQVQHSIAQQLKILTEREAKYRAGRAPINLTNRIAILTDDGIATGATMRAAVMFARKADAAKVIVAVPVAPNDSRSEFESIADGFICPNEVADFAAVGQFYGEFGQVEDAEAVRIIS